MKKLYSLVAGIMLGASVYAQNISPKQQAKDISHDIEVISNFGTNSTNKSDKYILYRTVFNYQVNNSINQSIEMKFFDYQDNSKDRLEFYQYGEENSKPKLLKSFIDEKVDGILDQGHNSNQKNYETILNFMAPITGNAAIKSMHKLN